MSAATRELLRALFPRGCRVRRSAHAIAAGISARAERGVVVGHGTELLTLVVRRDGRTAADAFHWSWWEHDPAPAVEHTTALQTVGRDFRYRCSCGKASRSPTSRWRARRNARAHRRAAVRMRAAISAALARTGGGR